MADPYTELISGNFIDAITSGYTNILGDWFYILLALPIIFAVYVKTDSEETAALIMLLIASTGFVIRFFPAVRGEVSFSTVGVWFLMIAFGLSILFAKFLMRRP